MKSNIHLAHDPSELGELERSILSIVWRQGQITAEQVREELGRPLKDSTIRTVLRRLEEKGYLAHSVENRTFVYRPAETRQRVAGRAVKRIVDWFCEGSVEALLVGMVDSRCWTGPELQRLRSGSPRRSAILPDWKRLPAAFPMRNFLLNSRPCRAQP
jgi:BlaI family transcriptional regulator, penicillinase repressor